MWSLGCMLDHSISAMCVLSHPCPYQCVCRHTHGRLGVPCTLSGSSSVLLQISLIIIHLDHHTYNNLHYNFLPRTGGKHTNNLPGKRRRRSQPSSSPPSIQQPLQQERMLKWQFPKRWSEWSATTETSEQTTLPWRRDSG